MHNTIYCMLYARHNTIYDRENQMKNIEFYKLNGQFDSEEPLNEGKISKANGMKVKVTTLDGEEYVGYLEKLIDFYGYVNLYTYKYLDEQSGKLIAPDGQDKYVLERERIFIKDMAHVDAILYSNPRWTTRLTNEYKFF